MKKVNTANTITTPKYRVMQSFKLPETVTLPNGKIIEAGTRIGPGEDQILKSLSKVALQKLLESGFIKEVGADGSIIENKNLDNEGRELYNDNFLRGLVQPNQIERAVKLLSEKRLSLSNLRVLEKKVKEIMTSGIDSPILKLLANEINSQIYDCVIINNES